MNTKLKDEIARLEHFVFGHYPKIEEDYTSSAYREMIYFWQDVTVTQEMQKMLDRARRKKMPKGLKKNLAGLIEFIKDVDENIKDLIYEQQCASIFKRTAELTHQIDNVAKLEIEHGFEPKSNHLLLLGKEGETLYEMSSVLNLTQSWGIKGSYRYDQIREQLEEIEYQGVDFIEAVDSLIKLKSYRHIEKALESESVLGLKNELGFSENLEIVIGEHDINDGKFAIHGKETV